MTHSNRVKSKLSYKGNLSYKEYWHTQTGLNPNYFIKESEYWHTQTGLNLNYLIKEFEYWHTQTGLNPNYLIKRVLTHSNRVKSKLSYKWILSIDTLKQG